MGKRTKWKAIADDQEGYVEWHYGATPGAALDKLVEEMDKRDAPGRTIQWLNANDGFLKFEEVPHDHDESDAG